MHGGSRLLALILFLWSRANALVKGNIDIPLDVDLSPGESRKHQSSEEEFIPVLPNPLRRLQANYETNSLGPGVSVITDCGCPGCCTLPRSTETVTIELTSTNYCFFTTTTVTTTDLTVITTQTTTLVTTKTTNLKIVETITQKTTSTTVSIFFSTSTVTNTITKTIDSLSVVTLSTLQLVSSQNFISRTVTRLIPFFTPYTIYIDTETDYRTIVIKTYSVSNLFTTITDYNGGTTLGTLFTTITNIIVRTAASPTLVTSFRSTRTQTVSFAAPLVQVTVTSQPPVTATEILTIRSSNIIPLTKTRTVVISPNGFPNFVPISTTITFSRLYPP